MKNSKLLSTVAALGLLAGQASASIIVSDNFSYPDGNLADNNGGTGWGSSWANNEGVPTVVNGRVNISATSGQQAMRTIPMQFKGDGSTLWLRFAAIAASDSTDNNTSTYGGVGFYLGDQELLLIGKTWGHDYVWATAAGGDNAYSTAPLRTASVVYARLQYVVDSDDKLDIWVNPADPASLESTPPDASRTAADLSFDTIRLRAGSGISVNESWRFDDLVLATSLADVASPVPAPSILSDPADASVLPGGKASFTTAAAGVNIGYQWYFGSTKLTESATVAGVKSSQLTLSGATSANAGQYTCVVTNVSGSATSKAATLVVQAVPTFANQTPASNAISIATNTTVSVQVSEGAFLDTKAIHMSVNGITVTPVITVNDLTATVTAPATTVLAASAQQVIIVWLTDINGNSFTNTWNFRTGSVSLPAVIPGPYTVGNGGSGLSIFTPSGDAWLSTNYNENANRTLFVRFSAAFLDLNGETGSGGGFGGLELYEDGNERFLMGNNWGSLNWSVAATVPDSDMNPATPVVLGEWHTVAAKFEFLGGLSDKVSVWLDPDFTQPLDGQPQTPVEFSGNFSFNTINLRCGNGTAQASFSNIVCAATSTGVGFAAAAQPQFANITPADSAPSASIASVIGLDVIKGSSSLNLSSLVLKVDDKPVTPQVAQNSGNLTVSYQPTTRFTAASYHSCLFSIQDGSGQTYSTTWSFTCDSYPSLPLTNTESFFVSDGGTGTTIFSKDNEWIRGQYTATATNTLYLRFSATFHDVNGENGGGGCYGGLELYNGNSERFLIGNNWASVNWSVAVTAPDTDMNPVTPIVPEEKHTIVAKFEFTGSTSDTVSVWLDPDFTKPITSQVNSPISFTGDFSFDSIHARCGNGTASATFENISIGSSSVDIGFAPPVVLSFAKTSPTTVTLTWTGGGSLQEATSVTGPWTQSSSQANPQVISINSGTRFYRVSK